MHVVAQRQEMAHDGVACLVIGGDAPILFQYLVAALFGAHLDALHSLDQMGLGNDGALFPGGLDGALVHNVFQVRAGGVGGALGDVVQVHVLRQGLALGMYLQNGDAPVDIGIIHRHLPVKPPGPQKGGVQDIPAVGGSHDDDALVGGKAVHFHKQLVQRLLPFVVPAAQAGPAMAAHGVDLVNKDDAGGVALGLLKQVPHPAGAYAHEHFHKIGAGNGEEGHVGFPRHGFGEQRFAGARRAHQQHALGDAGAQIHVLLGVFEEIHDLLELVLFLVRPGYVREGDLVFAGVHHGGPGFAEVHHLPAAARLLAHDIPPHHHQQHNGDQVGDQFQIPGGHHRGKVFDFKAQIPDRQGIRVHALFLGQHGEHGIVKIRADGGFKIIGPRRIIGQGNAAVLQPPHQGRAPDGDPVDFLVFDALEQFGILDASVFGGHTAGQKHDQKDERGDHHQVSHQATRHFTQNRFLLNNTWVRKRL